MRNRLIELLGKADEATEILTGDFPSYEEELQAFYTSIADHLLANGVIVLPCAVGDTVWLIYEQQEIHEMRVQGISVSVSGKDTILHFGGYPITTAWGSSIGEVYFLTREEAEAKLAEKGGGSDESETE